MEKAFIKRRSRHGFAAQGRLHRSWGFSKKCLVGGEVLVWAFFVVFLLCCGKRLQHPTEEPSAIPPDTYVEAWCRSPDPNLSSHNLSIRISSWVDTPDSLTADAISENRSDPGDSSERRSYYVTRIEANAKLVYQGGGYDLVIDLNKDSGISHKFSAKVVDEMNSNAYPLLCRILRD